MTRKEDKAGWAVAEWRQSVGIGHTKVCELIAAGSVKSVKIGRRRIITTPPAEFLAGLAEG